MDQFKIFQSALEEMYPSLSLFSDINWDEVAREYMVSHDERPTDLDEFIINFPDFLQEKCQSGDSPDYLFELAYVELLQNQILSTEIDYPEESGLHLNPTLSFLNLEYDINLMLDEAEKGNIQLVERSHILCIYRHPTIGLHHLYVTNPMIEILELIEHNKNIPDSKKPLFDEILSLGLAFKKL